MRQAACRTGIADIAAITAKALPYPSILEMSLSGTRMGIGIIGVPGTDGVTIATVRVTAIIAAAATAIGIMTATAAMVGGKVPDKAPQT